MAAHSSRSRLARPRVSRFGLTRRQIRAMESAVTRRRPPARVPLLSRLASLAALLAAAVVLIGVSVPVNVLLQTAPTPAEAAETTPREVAAQSLLVSAASTELPVGRDSFEVISYAEVLAIKYAVVDYSYGVTSGAVRWPFPDVIPINDGFGPRSDGFHKGIDLMAAAGTPVYAIADGVATAATFDGSGYGQHVVLLHDIAGAQVHSLYSHFIADSSPIVVGQAVKVGDFLGLVGDTGYTTAYHLHFEIHVDGVPVDPFAWLQANAV